MRLERVWSTQAIAAAVAALLRSEQSLNAQLAAPCTWWDAELTVDSCWWKPVAGSHNVSFSATPQ